MQKTAEVREQMVACRRFLNVIKRHLADQMEAAKMLHFDAEEAEIRACARVPDMVKSSAAKVFSTWCVYFWSCLGYIYGIYIYIYMYIYVYI